MSAESEFHFELSDVDEMPFAATHGDYEAISLELTSHWMKLVGAPLSIYQLGEVGAPGVSDLDFILVFETSRRVRTEVYEPARYQPSVRQYYTHPPYFASVDSWANLPAWLPTFNLRWLCGAQLPLPELPAAADAGIALANLVEYLIVKIPSDLLWLAWQRPVRVRTLLCMLNSLKYIDRLARSAGLKIPSMGALESQVSELRTGWLLHRSPVAELAILLGTSLRWIEEVYRAVDGLLHRSQGSPADSDFGTLCRFTKNWDLAAAVARCKHAFERDGAFLWEVPLSFSALPAHYAAIDGRYRSYARRLGFEGCQLLEMPEFSRGLELHVRAVVGQGGVTGGMKYIGMGYAPAPGLLSLPWKLARSVKRQGIGSLIRRETLLKMRRYVQNLR